jgi:hypothetical protein
MNRIIRIGLASVLPLLLLTAFSSFTTHANEGIHRFEGYGWHIEKWRDPYIGEWSNGRGETLVINGSTIKFGSDRAVPYRDVTRVTNGREFNIEITTEAKLNYLTRFLHISFGEGEKTDEMKMTLYDSRKDMEDGENSQGEATWSRDK